MQRLVVVGASLAGLRAAQAARAAGHEGELVVVGQERRLPYTRPPLSKGLLAGVDDVDACALPGADLDVTWRLGERAEALDLDARVIRLAGGDAVPFERAILATGCRARPWTGTGAGLRGVHTLRDLDDALALRAALTDGRPRLAVVGAGFVGCEVAASARALGLDVALLDLAPRPMPGLGERVGARCAELHAAHGVDLRLGTPIAALHGDGAGRVAQVETGDGTRIEADVVVVALGALPNTEWLRGSGLALEPGVVCQADLTATGAPDVLCAGDIAAWPHPLSPGGPVRIEHWTNAAEQGTHAGRNAVAEPGARRPYTSVPSFWSDQYDVKIQAVGFPRLAERVRVAESDGERFVAVGEREGRVVAALGWNAARRLPWYRRQIGERAGADALLAAVAQDPKAFGAGEAVAAR